MEKMYQAYKDIAEFFIVYISEAHALDDRSPVGYAEKLGIKEHGNYTERCSIADRLVKDKKLTIPCLIDGMDNVVEKQYKAHPDRVFLVREDGTLAVAGRRGPWGFKPGLNAANMWLAEYRETGNEPVLLQAEEDTPDIGELQRELFAAYQSADYSKALEVAETLHRLNPESIDTIYNIACMHCLLGHEEKAYTWLEKAVAAGYDNAEHLRQDDDFKTIRGQDRFAGIVERVREKEQRSESPVQDRASFASIVGDWEMETSMGERSIEATMSLSFSGGKLAGTWASMGRDMEMIDRKLDENKLTFKRRIGSEQELEFEGRVHGDRIIGKYTGVFGELNCKGKRKRSP